MVVYGLAEQHEAGLAQLGVALDEQGVEAIAQARRVALRFDRLATADCTGDAARLGRSIAQTLAASASLITALAATKRTTT